MTKAVYFIGLITIACGGSNITEEPGSFLPDGALIETGGSTSTGGTTATGGSTATGGTSATGSTTPPACASGGIICSGMCVPCARLPDMTGVTKSCAGITHGEWCQLTCGSSPSQIMCGGTCVACPPSDLNTGVEQYCNDANACALQCPTGTTLTDVGTYPTNGHLWKCCPPGGCL